MQPSLVSGAFGTIFGCIQLSPPLPFALSLHKQLLGTSPPLGSFIISASKACKSFMDRVRQYWGKPLGPCPVGISHRI